MKKNLDYREDYRGMPLYAKNEAFSISGEQLKKVMKNRNPFKYDSDTWNHIIRQSGYDVTQLRDGTWWVKNFRSGAPLFAPDYWWHISNTAGKRAKKIKDFMETL